MHITIYCGIVFVLSSLKCFGAPFTAGDSCGYDVNII